GSISADALNQKGREFQQKVNDLERNVQGKRQALEKSNGEALSKIQEQMLKIIADIARDRKSNLVFQRADLVLFDQSFDVTDEAPLETAGSEDISFLENRKYLEAFIRSDAGAAFVDEKAVERAPPGMALLVSNEPYKAYAVAAGAFYPPVEIVARRAASAIID